LWGSVAKWLNAADCKSVGLVPSQVRILPGPPVKLIKQWGIYLFMFHVYILVNNKGKYYIGQTNSLERRLFQHNNSIFGYAKAGRPWRLVYYESFQTRSDAIYREKQIKSFKGGYAFKKLVQL
jgi:putative endonuclease